MAPTHRMPAGNSQDQRQSSASGQLRQRIVADGDDSASTCCVKLRTVEPMSTSFDQRLLRIPVTNQAMIQYSSELNRSAPTISTPKKSRIRTRAGGSSLFGTRRSTGPWFRLLLAHVFLPACQSEIDFGDDNSGTADWRSQIIVPTTAHNQHDVAHDPPAPPMADTLR